MFPLKFPLLENPRLELSYFRHVVTQIQCLELVDGLVLAGTNLLSRIRAVCCWTIGSYDLQGP
jgi:hypothetical protein